MSRHRLIAMSLRSRFTGCADPRSVRPRTGARTGSRVARVRVTRVLAGIRFVLAALLLAAALIAAPVEAIVYVTPTDESLVDRSPVIVFGEVLAAEPAPVDGLLSTDFMFQVEEVLKGFVPGSIIVVRQPGGRGPDGLVGAVMGLPTLVEGDRVLLFLDPANAVYRTVELSLGMFFEAPAPGGAVLLREASLDEDVSPPGSPAAQRQANGPRDAERFRRWIADRASGVEREADYFAPELGENPAALAQAYKLTRSVPECDRSGELLRWPEFDRDRGVGFFVQAGGQPGVPGGGISQVLAGMRAWNGDPRSRSRLTSRGARNEEFKLEADKRNSITFEDPHDEIAGSFDPSEGGILAINWVFFFCGQANEPHRIPGGGSRQALAIVESNITTQDGFQDWLARSADPRRDFEEIMGHELGHALGIGHACDPKEGLACNGVTGDALMRAFVHGDGRGARLGADDRLAVRALYPRIDPVGPVTPAAATDLTVTPISQTELELRWQDRSSNETAFDVYERMIDSDFERIATLDRNSTSLVIQNIPPATFRAYQVVARNGGGSALPTPEAGATTFAEVAECAEDEDTLCLNDGRFRVEVRWETSQDSGRAETEPLINDTGGFWFFSPTNTELVVKVLNGCDYNERYWVYAGGLTDVKVIMTVIDSETGVAATYYNPPATPFRPVQDNESFAVCSQGGNYYGQSRYLLTDGELESARGGTDRTSRYAAALAEAPRPGRVLAPQENGACKADDRTLCLEDGRFAVRARWETADGAGDAVAWRLTSETGLYWFFNPDNVEMVVKVLNGCDFTGHRWVYAAGLTDQEVSLTVTDTETGVEKAYGNPAGALFQPIQDKLAFPCSTP